MSPRLLVKDLPVSATREEIHELLSPIGHVISIRVVGIPIGDPTSAVGLVEMENVEAAEKAVEMLTCGGLSVESLDNES